VDSPALRLDHLRVATRRTADQLLAEARERIGRFSPEEADAAARDGALIVDIRSELQRDRLGVIRGSLHIPRTVLEWRVEQDGRWRNPHVGGLERQLIVVCDDGYASSLAAATLADLGFADPRDVIGGFSAWRAAGLPIAPAPAPRAPDVLAGMGPPEP